MNWSNGILPFFLIWILLMCVYEYASEASASSPSDTVLIGRKIVQAIDDNTKAIREQTRRCR